MARWSLFAGLTATVLLLLVVLARLSATAVSIERTDEWSAGRTDEQTPNGGVVETDHFDASERVPDVDSDESYLGDSAPDLAGLESMSTSALLVNVALSQGLFGGLLLVGAWYAEVPLSAFGVLPGDPWNLGLPALGIGVGFGLALYVGNELLGKVVDDLGVAYSEELREMLAPDSVGGWIVLLVVVLPLIAGLEEFLFRAAVVGALSAGFGVSPWLLAVVSSIAFAVGHGMQGPGGVVVTGLLGFVLAAGFILTGSLLVVVVAHYLVNVLEFVIHEGLGLEPFERGADHKQ